MNAQPQLRGKLASLGLLPLARFLCSLGKSGDLVVVRDSWRARLSFDRGRLIAALAEQETGWRALEFVLLGMRRGDFHFINARPSLEPNLEASDGAQLWTRLERLAAAGEIPGPTLLPRLTTAESDAEQTALDLDRATLSVLLAVDGQADVAALAATHGGLRALRGLARLHALDLLTFEPPPVAAPTPLLEREALAPAPDELPATEATPPAPRRGGVLRRLGALPAVLGLLGLSLALVPQAVVAVSGGSMSPSLASGQLLFVNRAAYLGGGPRRGDVIVFRHAGIGFEDEYVVKRVIGLPGDLVQVDTGQVFVNGLRLDEPYVAAPDDYTYPLTGGPLRVPEGAYFVLGDNRPLSADSHLGWFVSHQDLVGQAWPLPVAVPARAPLNS